jgi:hypothetical protein
MQILLFLAIVLRELAGSLRLLQQGGPLTVFVLSDKVE